MCIKLIVLKGKDTNEETKHDFWSPEGKNSVFTIIVPHNSWNLLKYILQLMFVLD